MTLYQCSYCKVTFANPTTLKRHISNKHAYNSGKTSKITYEEEPGLWNDNNDSPINEAELWDDDDNLHIDEPELWNDDDKLPIDKAELWNDDDNLPTEEVGLWVDDDNLPTEDPMVRLR